MKLLYLTSLILLSAVFAQTGSIRGKVLDSTNDSPLIGANVVIKNTTKGSATDVEGKFEISNLEPGQYTLMVSYIGYKNYEESFKIDQNQNLEKNLLKQTSYFLQ